MAASPCDGVYNVPHLKHLTIGCQNVAESSDPPDPVRRPVFWPGTSTNWRFFITPCRPSRFGNFSRGGIRRCNDKQISRSGYALTDCGGRGQANLAYHIFVVFVEI